MIKKRKPLKRTKTIPNQKRNKELKPNYAALYSGDFDHNI
jgi:hypothetical protein